MPTVLSISASASTPNAGLQADLRTIRDLGADGVTAITSVTVLDADDPHSNASSDIHPLPASVIEGQIRAIYAEGCPQAIKIGMINDPDTIRMVRQEVVGCPRIVCSLSILSSRGGCLMTNEAIHAYRQYLIPICTLLMLKCTDAEILLGHSISTDQDMEDAAHTLLQMGATWVLLRGGTYISGRINALLMSNDYRQRFSSVNIEGWQRHGVAGTLSTAIATRLALGDDLPSAVSNAHDYLHSQVVYATPGTQERLRPHDLYNQFLSLVADHYRTAHDVAYYAQRMTISTRYLAQITATLSGRSPKQIIDGYLLHESEQLLSTSTQTIQQISDFLGFSSQVTFTKFFKSKKGLSPQGYRSRR